MLDFDWQTKSEKKRFSSFSLGFNTKTREDDKEKDDDDDEKNH